MTSCVYSRFGRNFASSRRIFLDSVRFLRGNTAKPGSCRHEIGSDILDHTTTWRIPARISLWKSSFSSTSDHGYERKESGTPTMAQPVRAASSKPGRGGPKEAEDLMRRRSADSIMASAESPSSQKQAGYMYAFLPVAPSKEALAYEAPLSRRPHNPAQTATCHCSALNPRRDTSRPRAPAGGNPSRLSISNQAFMQPA
jgi:hypothetical protein